MRIDRKVLLIVMGFCFLLTRCVEAAPLSRVGVLRFTSKADEVSARQISQVTDIIARILANSKTIAVIERERLDAIAREHRLNMSGMVDSDTAIQTGKLAGCQYILLGSVTKFTTKGRAVAMVGGETEVTATIDARLIDVTTSKVVLSLAQTGSAGTAAFHSSEIGNSSIRTKMTTVQNSPKEQAIAAAAARIGDKVREAVAGEYTAVITVNGKDIRINRGATSGVKVGVLYRVYMEGTEFFDTSGASLGHKAINLAVVKIKTVRDEISIAEVLDKAGSVSVIRRGDKLEAITQSEASDLIKQASFSTKR